MNNLDQVWFWILQARKRGYHHPKRNFKISDVTPETLIIRMVEELGEISQAHTRDGGDLEEIVDLLALLLHYAQLKGYDCEMVASACLEKLRNCFEEQ